MVTVKRIGRSAPRNNTPAQSPEADLRRDAAQYRVPAVAVALSNVRANLDVAQRGLGGCLNDLRECGAGAQDLEAPVDAIQAAMQEAMAMMERLERVRTAVDSCEAELAGSPGYVHYHRQMYGVEPAGGFYA